MSTPRPPGAMHQQHQQQQHNGQLLQPSQPNTPQWNGASDAVQAPSDPGASSDPFGASTPGHDAMREGKQKAKETMAAAGVGPGTPSGHEQSANGPAQMNGAPQLSKKRSRDGSQIPVSQTTAGGVNDANVSASENHRSHNEALLDRYVQKDLVHGAAMNDQAERSRELIKEKDLEKEFYMKDMRQRRQADPASVFGKGFMGYGNGTTDAKSHILYNAHRQPPKGRRTRELRIPRKDNAQQAEQHEELVPVRLDVELDKLRLRDTFTWNLHEKLISPDLFTEYLLEDLKLPPEATPEIGRQVKAEMQEQLQNFYPHIIVEDGALETGKPYSDHKDDEMRVMIKLNIAIGRITLVDQFEWDINNPLNSPEEFARQMAWENALSGEFTTAIAHSIREQSQPYTKSLFLTNHAFDGRPVEDPDVRDAFLHGPIHSAFRPPQAQKDWTPYMYEMSEAELERTETSMMREHRAQKRQLNRRGGPALPDLKEKPRTLRSLIVHSVIPGGVETFENTGIPKTRRSGGRGGRRTPRADGDADSDEMESEESGPDSPAPSAQQPPGTARTRGMRGAATVAQAAMKANLGRSVTPDAQNLPTPAEPRASTRRSGLRDGSVAPADDTLVVRLKIGKAKLRSFLDSYRAKKRASEFPLSGYASQPPPPNTTSTPSRPALGTPAASARPSRHTPQPAAKPPPPVTYDATGTVDIDAWPGADDAPPAPPPWLSTSLTALRARHRDSTFEAVMRPYTLSLATGKMERVSPALEPGDAAPQGLKIVFQPRIRCLDCPWKLYSANPGEVEAQFEVHLRNRGHRERVAGGKGGG